MPGHTPVKFNLNKRKGNLLKRVFSKAVVTSTTSTTRLPQHSDALDLPEEILMAREEGEQTQIDKFWGIDKDIADRQVETSQMAREDALSQAREHYLHIQALHRAWDEEFLQQEEMQRLMEKENNARFRVDHLKLINSPLSMEELLQEIWTFSAETVADSRPLSHQGSNSLLLNQLDQTKRSVLSWPQGADGSLSQLTERETAQPSLSIAELSEFNMDPSLTLEPMRMSVHLDGLQRGKEIMSNAKVHYQQLLKDLHKTNKSSKDSSTLELSQSTSPSLAQGSLAQELFPSKSSLLSQETRSTKKSKTKLSALQELAQTLKAEAPPVMVSDALLGHPTLQWDQEALLFNAFTMLDKEGKGYLSREDLQRVSFDKEVHSFLQYTVLWSVIKKREWSFFERMLSDEPLEVEPHLNPLFPPPTDGSHKRDNDRERSSIVSFALGHRDRNGALSPLQSDSRPFSRSSTVAPSSSSSTAPQQRVRPAASVSYTMWLESAITLCRQQFVHVKYVRTQAEHEQLCSSQAGRTHLSHGGEGFGMLRDFCAMRQLSVGDCVWVLHRRGTRWLPAVIEKIHTIPHPTLPGHSSQSARTQSHDMVLGSGLTPQSHSQRSSQSRNGAKRIDDSLFNDVNQFVSSDKRTNPFPCYHYDLWIPLNEQELFRSRVATTSSQLLTLPSQQQLQAQTLGVPSILKPKPFLEEKNVCSYAFDVIDVNATGILELFTLVANMQALPLQQIVDTSLVLTLIFRTSPPQIEERLATFTVGITSTVIAKRGRKIIRKRKKIRQPQLRMPCLLSVLVDTFSTSEEDEENESETNAADAQHGTKSSSNNRPDSGTFSLTRSESAPNTGRTSSRTGEKAAKASGDHLISMGCISKTDFLEFCDAVYFAYKYDGERLKPPFILMN